MNEAFARAGRFGFFPFMLGVFFLAPAVSGAAILYGPDAHSKEYALTATSLPDASTDGWDRLGEGTLGVFFSVTKDGSSDLLSPEVLLLPCVPERSCVSLALEAPASLPGIFSFLRTATALAVDAESATDLETMTKTLCSLKQKSSPSVPYRASIDVVLEDSIIHREFTSTGCDLTYPKKRSGSFLFQIFARGVLTN